jgi:hypothetical protein
MREGAATSFNLGTIECEPQHIFVARGKFNAGREWINHEKTRDLACFQQVLIGPAQPSKSSCQANNVGSCDDIDVIGCGDSRHRMSVQIGRIGVAVLTKCILFSGKGERVQSRSTSVDVNEFFSAPNKKSVLGGEGKIIRLEADHSRYPVKWCVFSAGAASR